MTLYEWNGQTYRGRRAVATAAGVSMSAVSRHMERNGNLDTLGAGRGAGGGWASPVEACGRSWPSQSAMARDLGVWPDTVGRWLDDARTDLMERAIAKAEARA